MEGGTNPITQKSDYSSKNKVPINDHYRYKGEVVNFEMQVHTV